MNTLTHLTLIASSSPNAGIKRKILKDFQLRLAGGTVDTVPVRLMDDLNLQQSNLFYKNKKMMTC